MNAHKDLNQLSIETIAAKIRPYLPEINKRIDEGIRHQQIVDWLREKGIDVSIYNFRSTLYRWRRQQGIRKRNPKESSNPVRIASDSSMQAPIVKGKSPSDFRAHRTKTKIDLESFKEKADE